MTFYTFDKYGQHFRMFKRKHVIIYTYSQSERQISPTSWYIVCQRGHNFKVGYIKFCLGKSGSGKQLPSSVDLRKV